MNSTCTSPPARPHTHPLHQPIRPHSQIQHVTCPHIRAAVEPRPAAIAAGQVGGVRLVLQRSQAVQRSTHSAGARFCLRPLVASLPPHRHLAYPPDGVELHGDAFLRLFLRQHPQLHLWAAAKHTQSVRVLQPDLARHGSAPSNAHRCVPYETGFCSLGRAGLQDASGATAGGDAALPHSHKCKCSLRRAPALPDALPYQQGLLASSLKSHLAAQGSPALQVLPG